MPIMETTEDGRQVTDLTERFAVVGYREPKAWCKVSSQLATRVAQLSHSRTLEDWDLREHYIDRRFQS